MNLEELAKRLELDALHSLSHHAPLMEEAAAALRECAEVLLHCRNESDSTEIHAMIDALLF